MQVDVLKPDRSTQCSRASPVPSAEADSGEEIKGLDAGLKASTARAADSPTAAATPAACARDDNLERGAADTGLKACTTETSLRSSFSAACDVDFDTEIDGLDTGLKASSPRTVGPHAFFNSL